MRVSIERSRYLYDIVELTVAFSHEEKAIIEVGQLAGETFADFFWSAGEEGRGLIFDRHPGELLHRPTITYEDLLKGEPVLIRTISVLETGFLELEQEIRRAAEKSKQYLESIKQAVRKPDDFEL